VGIANVMVISVLERRGQIGLRRAFGAIGMQFLGVRPALGARRHRRQDGRSGVGGDEGCGATEGAKPRHILTPDRRGARILHDLRARIAQRLLALALVWRRTTGSAGPGAPWSTMSP
jgi:hypothetical protein